MARYARKPRFGLSRSEYRFRLGLDWNSTRGSVLLEFAVCVSLLFFLAFSAVSLSLALRERVVLSEAARVGARAASMVPAGAGSELINETALFAAAKYLDRSGYPSGRYLYKISPTHFTLAKTGDVNLLKLRIAQRDAGTFGLFANFVGPSVLTAEFPLSGANSARSFDSEVAFEPD